MSEEARRTNLAPDRRDRERGGRCKRHLRSHRNVSILSHMCMWQGTAEDTHVNPPKPPCPSGPLAPMSHAPHVLARGPTLHRGHPEPVVVRREVVKGLVAEELSREGGGGPQVIRSGGTVRDCGLKGHHAHWGWCVSGWQSFLAKPLQHKPWSLTHPVASRSPQFFLVCRPHSFETLPPPRTHSPV